MGNALGGVFATVIVVFVALGIFLAMREIWCWYWKINEAVVDLRAILIELQKLNAREEAKTTASGPVFDMNATHRG